MRIENKTADISATDHQQTFQFQFGQPLSLHQHALAMVPNSEHNPRKQKETVDKVGFFQYHLDWEGNMVSSHAYTFRRD